MSPTADLQEQGYEVRFHHARITEDDLEILEKQEKRLKWAATGNPDLTQPKHVLRDKHMPIAGRGGYTRATIVKDEQIVAEGEAWCNPEMDNFNKKVGREIALGRALKQLNLS